MNTNLIAADTAITTLVAEGHTEADVLAVYDSLIEAGLEVPNDDSAITAAELDLMRDELSA